MAVSRETTPAEPAPTRKMGDSASLAELVGVILDKGIVIDAWARVSVVGIEILTIEARVVVASVDTYLRYAEAIGLTALAARPPEQQVTGTNGRGQEQEAGRQLPSGQEQKRLPAPSEDDILRYLSDHPEGLQPEAMQLLLDAPREQLDEVLDDLVEENKVRRDEEHNLYLPEQR